MSLLALLFAFAPLAGILLIFVIGTICGILVARQIHLRQLRRRNQPPAYFYQFRSRNFRF